MTILEVLDNIDHLVNEREHHNLDDEEIETLKGASRELIQVIKADARNDREVIPDAEPDVDELAYTLTLSVVRTLCSQEVHKKVVEMLKEKMKGGKP